MIGLGSKKILKYLICFKSVYYYSLIKISNLIFVSYEIYRTFKI